MSSPPNKIFYRRKKNNTMDRDCNNEIVSLDVVPVYL